MPWFGDLAAHQTIQSAVDAVTGSGYTIYVCPDTYNTFATTIQDKHHLTIRNYPVSNQPAPVIDSGGDDAFVITTSSNITLRGLDITNVSVGVLVKYSPETTVRDMSISGGIVAIAFFHSPKGKAINTSANGFGDLGISVEQSDGTEVTDNTVSKICSVGIQVRESTKVEVRKNTVTVSGRGIELEAATRATLDRNTTNNNGYGLRLLSGSTSKVSNGTAIGNATGFFVSSEATGNTFTNNRIANGKRYTDTLCDPPVPSGETVIDVVDYSHGTKTAGTANTWSNTTCDTSEPVGLCKRRANPNAPAVSIQALTSSYDPNTQTFNVYGDVVNAGSVPVYDVKVIGTFYDSVGRAKGTKEGSPSSDTLAPGQRSSLTN